MDGAQAGDSHVGGGENWGTVAIRDGNGGGSVGWNNGSGNGASNQWLQAANQAMPQ